MKDAKDTKGVKTKGGIGVGRSRTRGRPVPVPEGRRRKLAGGKSAPADAAPGNRAGWLHAPAGHRRKWPEATSGGGHAAGYTLPKISSMPRWGMVRSAVQPGAAPAGAGLPPANFLRSPSGTKSRASATILRPSAGGHGGGKIRAAHAGFSRSAAVGAEHQQQQQIGRWARLGFHRWPPRFRGRCGWSSADTAALRSGGGSAALFSS